MKLDFENRKAIEGIEEAKQISEELEKKKRKIDELNILAQQLYDEGKYHEAIDKWKDVLNLDLENQMANEGIKKAEEKLQVKKYCSGCGHPNTRGLKYCTQCGAKLFEA